MSSHADHAGRTGDEWQTLQPLLDEWQCRVRDSQFLHYECSNHFGKLNYCIGIPAVVLASVVGTAIFATLSKDVALWARFVVAFISVIAAILSGLQTFLRLGERAERHRLVGSGYAAVHREIELLNALPNASRGDGKKVMEKIRVQIDALVREAPAIPRRVWSRRHGRYKDHLAAAPPGGQRAPAPAQ